MLFTAIRNNHVSFTLDSIKDLSSSSDVKLFFYVSSAGKHAERKWKKNVVILLSTGKNQDFIFLKFCILVLNYQEFKLLCRLWTFIRCFLCYTKGQLISEGNFGVFKSALNLPKSKPFTFWEIRRQQNFLLRLTDL